MKSSNLAVVIKGHNFALRMDALNNKTQCLAFLLKKTNCRTVVVGIDTSRKKKYIPASVRRCLYVPLRSTLLFPFTGPCLAIFFKVYNAFWIYFFIKSYCKKNKITTTFILYDDFQVSIITLKLLCFSSACNFICCVDEWGPASARDRFHYMKQRFVISLLLKLCDGSLAISSYIFNRIIESKLSRLCLHLPAISHISAKLPSKVAKSAGNFIITYAANIAYQDQLNVVLQGFLLFKRSFDLKVDNSSISLNIVLSGNDLLIKEFQDQLISEKLCKDIIIFNSLDELSFACLLSNSSVLLCPLSNNINNIARFPQKLSEYSSAHGLIIVSQVGDVSLYFIDMVNSIFLANFDPHSIFESLQTAFLLEPANLASMKSNARIVFDKHFSIDANAVRLKDFLAKFN